MQIDIQDLVADKVWELMRFWTIERRMSPECSRKLLKRRFTGLSPKAIDMIIDEVYDNL